MNLFVQRQYATLTSTAPCHVFLSAQAAITRGCSDRSGGVGDSAPGNGKRWSTGGLKFHTLGFYFEGPGRKLGFSDAVGKHGVKKWMGTLTSPDRCGDKLSEAEAWCKEAAEEVRETGEEMGLKET